MFNDLSDWFCDHLVWIVAIGIPFVLAVCIWAAIADQNQWNTYAKQHHCVAVGKKIGQASAGLSMDGKGTIVTSITPDQIIYQCDAGEIEIR